MYTRTVSLIAKTLLCILLLALFINPAGAQTKKKSKNTAMPQASAQQMRRTTNADRWAAAARHGDRRADSKRKQSKGVK